MFRKIVVALDPEHAETADKAVAAATWLARPRGGPVDVIGIRPDLIDESGRPPPEYRRKLMALMARHAGADGVGELHEVGGSIPADLRQAAEEMGADLIVMGTCDARPADHMPGDHMPGPEAIQMALETPCSVLVVR